LAWYGADRNPGFERLLMGGAVHRSPVYRDIPVRICLVFSRMLNSNKKSLVWILSDEPEWQVIRIKKMPSDVSLDDVSLEKILGLRRL